MKKTIIIIIAIITSCFAHSQPQYTLSVEIKYDSIFSLDGKYFAVKQSGKWGVVKDKQEIIPCIYQGIDALGDGVISIINDNKIGFIDTLGNTLLAPTYTIEKQNNTEDKSQINVYDNGACLVEVEGEYKLINKQNQQIIPDEYQITSRIGDAVSIKKDGKYGISNTKGEILLYPQYLDISILIDSKLYSYKQVTASGIPLYGLIDGKGKILTPPIYIDFGHYNSKTSTYLKAYTEDGKQALLNEDGKTIIPPMYQVALPTQLPKYFTITQNLEQGIIGSDSVIYVPPAYERIEIMITTDTFFLAHKTDTTHIYNTHQTKLAEIQGNILDITTDKNQNVYFVIEHNFSYGIQNQEGKWIIQPTYDEILAIVSDNICFRKADKWGVVNLNNQPIIDFKYKQAKLSPSKTFFVLYDNRKDSKLLNQQGKIHTFASTDNLMISNNYVEYKEKKTRTRLYENGIYKPEHIKNIKNSTNDILCVQTPQGWTYYSSTTFQPLTNQHYHSAGPFLNNIAIVYQDNQLKTINNKYQQQDVILNGPIDNIDLQITYLTLKTLTQSDHYIIKNKNKYGVITIKQ